MSNIGILLLAIWLILQGIIPLLGIRIPSEDVILGILAIAAGVLLLLPQRKMRFTGNLGMLLLSIWLIVLGVIQVLQINFPASTTILAILAIAAGVLLLLKR
jgi:hypothetical protein